VRAAASSGVRLAELVATISLGTDLGLGQSMEHILRQTLVSLLRMAELLAFDEAEREVAYFSGLLAWVGCHTDAYEQAKWFGDDIALKRDGYHYDMGTTRRSAYLRVAHSGTGAPTAGEIQDVAGAPAGGTPKRDGGPSQTIGWPRTSWPAASASANRCGAVSRKASSVGTARASAVRGARRSG
jgi:hypothetical protein